MAEVYKRVTFFRGRANLSARELSLRIGKHSSYINKFENKEFIVPLPVLFEIIDALDSTPEEFFADNFSTFQSDKNMNNLFRSLTNNSKSVITEMMKNLK